MNPMNKKDVQLVLNRLDIKPKKNWGQNFLIDNNIASKIISEAEISDQDTILEIGPGLGAITEDLIKSAKKVYLIEKESKFCSYLLDKFSTYDNVEIINDDILKVDIPPHDKVVSNIPYTITGPILEKVFYTRKPPTGIISIEKNIAERIFLSNNYKNFSRISVTFNSFMIPTRKFDIPRRCFYPAPKIDVTLIKIVPKENLDPYLEENDSRSIFLKFIAGIMPYKNKDIVNALFLFFKSKKKGSFSKEQVLNILQESDFGKKKLFSLKIEEFLELCKLFYTYNDIK